MFLFFLTKHNQITFHLKGKKESEVTQMPSKKNKVKKGKSSSSNHRAMDLEGMNDDAMAAMMAAMMGGGEQAMAAMGMSDSSMIDDMLDGDMMGMMGMMGAMNLPDPEMLRNMGITEDDLPSMDDFIDDPENEEQLKEEIMEEMFSKQVRLRITMLEQLQKQHDAAYDEKASELRALQIAFENSLKTTNSNRRNLARDIPGFWSKVLQTNKATAAWICDFDKEILSHCVDIECFSFPSPLKEGEQPDPDMPESGEGCLLRLIFSENKYFKNRKLIKKYEFVTVADSQDKGERILRSAVGTEIDWTKRSFQRDSHFSALFETVNPDPAAVVSAEDTEKLQFEEFICSAFQNQIVIHAIPLFLKQIPDQNADDDNWSTVSEDYTPKKKGNKKKKNKNRK